MKRILCLFLIVFSCTVSYADKNQITKENLPDFSIVLLNRYYNDVEIKYCIIDEEWWGNKEYDVYLDNGIKIEFDERGTLKSIETPIKGGINLCLLPIKIHQYIVRNFYDYYVCSYKVKNRGRHNEQHEVNLSNNYKLTFSKNSCFVEVGK